MLVVRLQLQDNRVSYIEASVEPLLIRNLFYPVLSSCQEKLQDHHIFFYVTPQQIDIFIASLLRIVRNMQKSREIIECLERCYPDS